MLSVKTMVSSFKTWSLPMQNSYCDHRNFDSVIKPAFQDKRSNVLLFFALRELALKILQVKLFGRKLHQS